ncbi:MULTISPECIES: response regulator [unclassified Thalassospira]|uniref:response regulator n=1 Tax=unclassified Thalassospira TaxID=2648997 RepID=UPI0025E59787|nr:MULTISPECIES: response regulator transcription factor [unclassified Thalassospira]|tara:strand:+ start:36562 stop:37296 length:735 start_codon:yes stop_codon:yes gene_type:complete
MKILLVEDDNMHADFLLEIVEQTLPEFDEILVANNGKEAETLAHRHQITAIVMDLRMKEHNGIEAARTIWAGRPNTRILFWSNYSDEAYLRGITRIVPDQAAYGYVLKTATQDKMRLALRAVLIEAQIVVDREVHQIQAQQMRSRSALTEFEYLILLDLALGLPDKAIAMRRKLSLRTVQNRLLSLYDKLDVEAHDQNEMGVVLNKRTRAVSSAIARKIINREGLITANKELSVWLERSSVSQD